MLNSVFFKVLILTSRLAAIGRILRTQLLKTDKEIWLINRWHKTNQETSWVRASHQKRMRPLCKKILFSFSDALLEAAKKKSRTLYFPPAPKSSISAAAGELAFRYLEIQHIGQRNANIMKKTKCHQKVSNVTILSWNRYWFLSRVHTINHLSKSRWIVFVQIKKS